MTPPPSSHRAVLITGGATRVGAATASALADKGWAVGVHYNRSEDAANQLVGDIIAGGGRAVAMQADLTDRAALADLVPNAAARLGQPLTALVNNASTFEDDGVTDMTHASWDFHMDANLRAPCFLAQAFAAHLAQCAPTQPASVVNIIDQRVKKPTPQFFSYGISKAGLAWATVTMAQALAPTIRVNAVAPGPTLRNARQDEASWQTQVEATLLQTGSPPDAITDAVSYLLDASAVTGQVLVVDGGQHLAWKTADVWGISE